jgi:hypothetical protein
LVDLLSPTAPTTTRKEAARAARKAYEKRKTRQMPATREQVAADAEVDLLPDKSFRQHEIVGFGRCGAVAGPQVGGTPFGDSPGGGSCGGFGGRSSIGSLQINKGRSQIQP